MSQDGRPDSERNRYNVAGVQVANPQSTGDISIGSLDRDPTGRVISRNLSLPIDPSTNKPIDGYVLTVDSSDTVFGAGWRAPIAQVSGDPDKVAGFDSTGQLETKSNLTVDSGGLTLGLADRTKQGLIIEANESGFGKATLEMMTESNQSGSQFIVDARPVAGTTTSPRALLVNDQIRLEGTSSSNHPISLKVSSVAVRADNQLNRDIRLSSYALAQFANDASHSTNDAKGRLISIPSNTLEQIQALPANLKAEYSNLATALSQNPAVIHGDSSVSMLVDNAIAYCHEDDSYYVYSQVDDQFVKLTTQSDVSAIGAMTAVESAAKSLTLTGGQAVDETITDMFNFGSIMKVKAVGSSSQTGNVTARLEFYRTSAFANEDFTGQIEIVIKPSQTTYAWASVPVEDDAGNRSIYVKIQNITQTTTLSADIQLKGAGV